MMKSRFLLGAVLLAATSQSGSAQVYSLDWFTVDGGGGTSIGSVYTLSGTIGQSDAGPIMTGGDFALTGGFWSIIAAIQTPGAPQLSIKRVNANSVMVWWPASATGWTLQQNSEVSSANWTVAGPAPIETNGVKRVIVSPAAGNRFFRLHKP